MPTNYADPFDLIDVFMNEFRARELSRDASHWAARNLVFRDTDPIPGPYKLNSFPPTIEIMKRVSLSDPCPEIWIVGPAQTGKSTVIQAMLGMIADELPCNVALYAPSDPLVEKWQSEKLEPMFERVSSLRHLHRRTKDRIHKQGHIELPPRAGHIALMNASSGPAFRQNTYRIAVVDDMDGCRAPGDGDIAALARSRTQLFATAGRKNIFVSTPTTKEGAIWRGWLSSSQNEYWTPCPHCDEFQVFAPRNWQWTVGQPSTIHLVCTNSACHAPIYQWQLPPLLVRGEWRARVPALLGIRECFRLSQALSPPSLADWSDYAIAHDKAQREIRQTGDHTSMQVVYNSMRGEPYEPYSDKKLDDLARTVLARAEGTPRFIPSQLPADLVWTVGTDVQRDRLESRLVGTGPGKECWVVERAVHEGRYDESDVWERWADWCISRNPSISAAVVDISFEREASSDQSSVKTSDRLSEMLHLFLANNILLWGIKGSSLASTAIWPSTPIGPGNLGSNDTMRPVLVGVSRVKTWIRSGLQKSTPSGPGVIHLDSTTTADHVRQLLSERRWRKGDPGTTNSRPWVRIRAKQAQEGLDCLVYAIVAVAGLCALPDNAGRYFTELTSAPVARQPAPNLPPAPTRRPVPIKAPGGFGFGGNPMGL